MRAGSCSTQKGFTYFGLLLAIGVAGLTLGMGITLLLNAASRDKEVELLYAGDQIRLAIEHYHALNSANPNPWPRDLDSLLRDPGQPGLVRHLRRIHRDPMTPKGEWVLLRNEGNGIVGVHSASTEVPLRRNGFPKLYETFFQAKNYSEWRFIAAGGVIAVPRSEEAQKAGTPPFGQAVGAFPSAPADMSTAPPTLNDPVIRDPVIRDAVVRDPVSAPVNPVPEPVAQPQPAPQPAPPATPTAPAAKPPAAPGAGAQSPANPGGAATEGSQPATSADKGSPAAPGAPGGNPAPGGQVSPANAPPPQGTGTAPAAAPAGVPATPMGDGAQPFVIKPFGQ